MPDCGRRSLYELVMHLKRNYAEATNMLAYHLIERGLSAKWQKRSPE